MAKTIFITATRVSLSRPSTSTVWAGTLDELINDVFGYTLECGHSWNSKVNMNPRSAKSLVTALNKASEASCRYYQNCYYELSTNEEIEAYKNANGDNMRSSYRLSKAA